MERNPDLLPKSDRPWDAWDETSRSGFLGLSIENEGLSPMRNPNPLSFSGAINFKAADVKIGFNIDLSKLILLNQ